MCLAKIKTTRLNWSQQVAPLCSFICKCAYYFSHVQLFESSWTVAHQAPLSMAFSRQTYWSGLPCSPPRDVPNPGIEPRSPALQVDSLSSEPPGKPQRIGRSLNMCVTDYKHCLPWVLLLKIFAFPYVILVQYFAAILVGIRCDILLGDTL